MRIAVISDMHGNCLALDAAQADIRTQSVDQIVCLGDAIQGGPQPAEVIARLRELACPVVMGNADHYLLYGEASDAEPISDERNRQLDAVREWSLSKLSADDQAFIAAFHPTVEITLEDGRKLLCFHGSPTSFDHVILPTTPEDEFNSYLASYVPAIMIGGHTHMQQIRRIGTSDTYYFNPGSVGFAYSHHQPDEASFRADPWAEYAILTSRSTNVSLEFRRVPFDAQTLIDIYRASGRPHTDVAIAQYGA
jgi:predicted phosphodiesterase